MKRIFSPLSVALAMSALLLGGAAPVIAQTAVFNQTTLAAAQGSTDTTISLTSASASSGSTFGAVQVGQGIFVDQEYELITGTTATSTVFQVQRRNNRIGTGGTGSPTTTHASGAIVRIGTPSYFQRKDPTVGVCGVNNQMDPWINIDTGEIWRCLGSQWFNVVDAFVFVGPGSCFGSTTGGTLTTPAAVANVNVYATTWTGLINSSTTAPGTPVLQVATTNAGTANNTVSCQIPIPMRADPSRAIFLADTTWVYGLQQAAANSTQVATEASGLLNGVLAFGKIVLPAAGASETASTVAQARADAGTMVLLPAKAAFNAGTTTTGAFFTQKISPATPFNLSTDGTIYYANLTVLHAATTASTLQVAGVLVHYYSVTGL